MKYDPSNLPVPPEFPTSNASYNSIAGKMHKAASEATSARGAERAVGEIVAKVTGVNTYAKKVRKYGVELVAAIKGKPVDQQAEKSAKAAAKMKANLAEKGIHQKGDKAADKRRAEGLPA